MSGLFEILSDDNATDTVVERTDDLLHVRRKWKEISFAKIRIKYNLSPTFWIIPGAVVNGNRQGRGIFPRPTLDNPWSFREDRSVAPAGACVEDDSNFVGVFLSPARTEDEIASVEVRRGEFVLRIPWEEKPWSYQKKSKLVKAKRAFFKPPRKQYIRDIYVIHGDFRVKGFKKGYKLFLRRAWEILAPQVPQKTENIGEHLRLRAQCVYNTLYYRRGGIAGFMLMLFPPFIPIQSVLSGTFCGKALEIALSYYRMYLLNGDKMLRKIALETADFFTRGLQKNGLYLSEYVIGMNRWYGYAVTHDRRANTRMMGEAGYFFTRLYQYARPFGDAHEEWLRVAQRIASFMISHQLPSGSFGKWWKLNGELSEDSGTNGAYIIWMLCELYKITGEEKYLSAAERAMEFYRREFIEKDSYWGDTLDADTPDKEAAHAILRAAILLYEVTKKKKYLDMAIEAAHAAASWQIMYKIPFSRKTPLGMRNYDTTGMTIVSVENQHLDIYGFAIAVDWYKLWKYTGDRYWKERALVAVKSAMQLTSTDKDTLGLPYWFAGWQPEQINHTNWTYSPFIKRGGFFNVIGWVYGLGMGGLLDLAELMGVKPSIGKIRKMKGKLYTLSKLMRNILSWIHVWLPT